jgi:DNA-binding transcriptional ArsR family regulator
MSSAPTFADMAALLGDPARANILTALMDGRVLAAKELAFVAGVSPQTTSAHLAKLAEGRLVSVEAAGRHRLYRLADPLVARAIEALMVLSAERPHRHRPPVRGGEALRAARTCYDHLAGRLGVAIADALIASGDLQQEGGAFSVTPGGQARFAALGIDIARVARQRRGFATACLDWSERRPHLAGALGAALAQHCFALGWIERLPGTRAIRLTAAGQDGFSRAFGMKLPDPERP